MIVTLKIRDVDPDKDREWLVCRVAEFLDQLDPGARVDLKVETLR
jgi:hypothetical protein